MSIEGGQDHTPDVEADLGLNRLGSRGKLSFPQLWSEQHNEYQREKINAGGKHEETAVAMRALQDMSRIEGNQKASH
jgi:hypothetical protein